VIGIKVKKLYRHSHLKGRKEETQSIVVSRAEQLTVLGGYWGEEGSGGSAPEKKAKKKTTKTNRFITEERGGSHRRQKTRRTTMSLVGGRALRSKGSSSY